jgi:hypothetical protein
VTKLTGAALDRAVANAMGLKSVNNCEKWGTNMKEHFCPAEQSTITYQGKCNWCGESEGSMTQETLKLALEALENGDVPTSENAGKNLDAITAIKEALAQTQEPEYAWPTVADYERDVGFQTNEAFRMAWGMARTTNKMLGHPSPPQRTEQEPKDWKTPLKEDAPLVKWAKEQTAPQRTWVGLTDEEENEYNYLGPDMYWVIQEIAAKLKELNT